MSASRTPIKKTLRRIAIFAVIVLVLYLFLPKLIDVEKTIAMLSGASYVLLAIAICFEALALLSYANLFRFVLSILDIRLRLREVLGITMSSFAVSHFLSAGGGWVDRHLQRFAQAQRAARPHLRRHRGAAVL